MLVCQVLCSLSCLLRPSAHYFFIYLFGQSLTRSSVLARLPEHGVPGISASPSLGCCPIHLSMQAVKIQTQALPHAFIPPAKPTPHPFFGRFEMV